MLIRILAVLGLGFFLQGLWIPSKALLAQLLIARAWEASVSGDPSPRPWPWADTWPVARIHLPETGSSLYALEGASGESLAFGPAHISASADPGDADNIAFAGHRDTHFAVLEELKVGQSILVESIQGFDTYQIEGTEIVHESRTDLLTRSGEPELTLITCYPFDAIVPGGPLRYIVHAKRISTQKRDTPLASN